MYWYLKDDSVVLQLIGPSSIHATIYNSTKNNVYRCYMILFIKSGVETNVVVSPLKSTSMPSEGFS